MEDTLIQDIAFWGIIAIASIFVALLVFAVMTILKRRIPVQTTEQLNPKQQETDIKIGRAIITRIDSLDDLINSRMEEDEDEALIRQLKHFRNDLISLLQNHSIEAYALEKGTMLDSSARKLIDIVDSEGSAIQENARIVEVVRLGYRYQKNLTTPSTIVRKPAVRIR